MKIPVAECHKMADGNMECLVSDGGSVLVFRIFYDAPDTCFTQIRLFIEGYEVRMDMEYVTRLTSAL